MRKLVVDESKLDSEKTVEISLFVTSRHAYGLTDFDFEKTTKEVADTFNLTVVDQTFPRVLLKDEEGRKITLKCVETHYD